MSSETILSDLYLPAFSAPVNPTPQPLPLNWSCTVLLHPFSPPPGPGLDPSPFFELCTADIQFSDGEFFYINILGESQRTWQYLIRQSGTSIWENDAWQSVDLGWTLPSTQLLGPTANCVGSSPLNWMEAQVADWWKMIVPGTENASIWYWLNTSGPNVGLPLRMMFGQAPPQPTYGNPQELAFFQMYSFSYFTNWNLQPGKELKTAISQPSIPGFTFGNESGYQPFVWNTNFGVTSFMTPVNELFSPLPTVVLYHWAADDQYQVLTDRAQYTNMYFSYNQQVPTNIISTQVALMFGSAPASVIPPPDSGTGFIINYNNDGTQECVSLPLAQEHPDWISTPGEEGTIRAVLVNNSDFCPNNTVLIYSALFPAIPNYPQGTYLWTWYSPMPDTPFGQHSRPVTFMQSASTLDQGTSLALADYFSYEEFSEPIDPQNFNIPVSCSVHRKAELLESTSEEMLTSKS